MSDMAQYYYNAWLQTMTPAKFRVEWKIVYDLVHSEDPVQHKQALEIIRVWKIRTPNLPVGVEGTLILLDAFLNDCTDYASFLLRFLNINAANGDRQGTFGKSAKDHNWPEWLIDVRHDIAHGTALPSKDMLDICFKYCWNWVKDNYWKQQCNNLKDYIVLQKSNDKRCYKVLYCYIVVNFKLYVGNFYSDLEDSLKSTLYSILPKKLRNLEPSLHVLLRFLLEMLHEEQSKGDFKSTVEEVMDVLVNPRILLYVDSELTENESRCIPKKFRDIWGDLLNVFLNQQTLFTLTNSLLTVTVDCINISDTRETAAAWILEIFRGLVRAKFLKETLEMQDRGASSVEEWCTVDAIIERDRPDLQDAINFGNPSSLPLEDANLFLNRTLKTPSEYTLIYLDSVFEFCGTPKEEADEARQAIKTLFLVANPVCDWEMKIADIDLDDENLIEDDTLIQETQSSFVEPHSGVLTQTRWRKIDSRQFEGCPLGVFPYQDRMINPLLKIQNPY